MEKKNSNEIELERRNEKSSSSVNVVDDSIKKILGYHLNKKKYFFLVFLYFLSCGILFLVSLISNAFFIWFTCEKDRQNFNYIEIIDEKGKHYLIKITFENFHKRNPKITESISVSESVQKMKKSVYSGKEMSNFRNENRVFTFRNNKYVFIEKTESFVPLFFDLTKFHNNDIIDKFLIKEYDFEEIGIKSVIEYNYLVNQYGLNKMHLSSKTYIIIFLSQMIQPLYLYNVYAIINWIIIEYWISSVIVGTLTIIIQIVTTNLESKNYERFKKVPQKVMVSRPFSPKVIAKQQIDDSLLVPGDIIYISKGTELPCDCLILEGECTVLESDLTGESSFVMKKGLEYNNEIFGFEGNEKSILYMGTQVKKCIGKHESNELIALVINTGFNTNRGNLIQNFQMKQRENFSFLKDLMKYALVSLFLWIISTVTLIIFNKIGNEVRDYFDNLTTLMPPSIHISLSFTNFYYHYILRKTEITCVEGGKLLIAGTVNTIVLDKTGTLTQTKLEIKGFKGISIISPEDYPFTKSAKNQRNNSFRDDEDDIHNKSLKLNPNYENAKSLNKIHKFFWRKIYEQRLGGNFDQTYQEDPKNLRIFLTECLASCHSVDLFEGDIFGNSIDKEIYDLLKWELHSDKEAQFAIVPKNSFKITENPKGKIIQYLASPHNKIKKIPKSEYKLKYLHRSEFYSKNQSMCVIVKNTLDNSIRLYAKGAPEKMLLLCKKETIPSGFEEGYMKLTQIGMRVLSCATRLINEDEWEEVSKTDKKEMRTKLEKELTFLGLIVFSNKLKKGTSKVITNLLNAKIKLVISTGDNPYTTLSVAKECGLLSNEEVFICDYEEKKFKINKIQFGKGMKEDSYSELGYKNMDEFSARGRRKDGSKEMSFLNASKKSFGGGMNSDRSNYPVVHHRERNGDKVPSLELHSMLTEIQNAKNCKICLSGNALSVLLKELSNKKVNLNQLLTSKKINYSFLSYFRSNSTSRKHTKKFSKELNQIELYYDQLKTLLYQVKEKGLIFFRMLPHQKAQLIQMLKQDGVSVVSMCGDGANDSNAITTSDVGVAIRQVSNQSLVSHFFSKIDSIVCLEKILQNGRACYESTIVVLEFMILSGVIQLTGHIILNIREYEFTTNMYIFFDFFCAVIPVFLASKTGEIQSLSSDPPYQSMINKRFLFNVIGQIIIQIAFIFGVSFHFTELTIDKSAEKYNNINDDAPQVYTSYIFILCVFQYFSVLFVFNMTHRNRKAYITNVFYTFYLSGILLFFFSVIILEENQNFFFGAKLMTFEDNLYNFEEKLHKNKLIIISYGILDFAVTLGYDIIINKILNKLNKNMSN